MFHKYANDIELCKDYLPNVSTDEAEQMEIVGRRNEAVSAMIDSYCGRRKGYFLAAPNTATTRTFRGENSRLLRIGVHFPGTAQLSGVNASQYYENELNGWLYASANAFGNCESFFARNQIYSVSARWGFEETPAEIIEATKIIVAHWFENGQGILGDVTPNGYIIQRDAPPTAKTLLEPFKKGEYEID